MTIIYNKNTPGQYIVTGLDSNEASETARGYHTRKTIGDFTVISSTKPVNPTNTVYDRVTNVMRKFLVVLAILPIVPFASSPAMNYINQLVKMK
jgi:hypothetical protein